MMVKGTGLGNIETKGSCAFFFQTFDGTLEFSTVLAPNILCRVTHIFWGFARWRCEWLARNNRRREGARREGGY